MTLQEAKTYSIGDFIQLKSISTCVQKGYIIKQEGSSRYRYDFYKVSVNTGWVPIMMEQLGKRLKITETKITGSVRNSWVRVEGMAYPLEIFEGKEDRNVENNF